MPLRNQFFRRKGAGTAASRWSLVMVVVASLLGTHYLGDLAPYAVAIVMCVAVAAVIGMTRPDRPDPPATLPDTDAIVDYLDQSTRLNGAVPGVIVLRAARAGREGADALEDGDMLAAGEAIRAVLRPEDVIAEIDEGTLAIALSMRARPSLEELIQIAMRVQRRLQAPVQCAAAHVSFDVAIGMCGPAMPEAVDGRSALEAARAAMLEGREETLNTIRMAARQSDGEGPLALQLATDLDHAFATQQIIPFFQPQVSTDTGLLTGVEALARWMHPDHGALAPGHFLPTIDAAGAHLALTDAILSQSLRALAEWDSRGIDVPQVSVNLTQADLTDATLVDRIEWMLDRHGIGPHRLCIEVLETVLSVQGCDAIPRTLSNLRDLGCRIDLDDFGTGQASIASIRKFCIDRLKIDRSFIHNLDRDTDQQGMVAAIVTMAEHLGLEVVAEGVETAGEHARAAELGCNQVQGYGIGRPMRADAVDGWVSRRNLDRTAMPEAMRTLPKDTSARFQGVTPRGRGNGKTA